MFIRSNNDKLQGKRLLRKSTRFWSEVFRRNLFHSADNRHHKLTVRAVERNTKGVGMFDVYTKNNRLEEVLGWRAQYQPEKPAYIFLQNGEVEQSRLSYSELDCYAKLIAVQIVERANQGDRVLLIFPFGLEFIVAFFACLYANVTAVPVALPNRKGVFRMEKIVTDSTPSLVISTPGIRNEFLANETLLPGLSISQWLTFNNDSLADCSTTSPIEFQHDIKQELAFLQYTSGSTGNPKGVMISCENLMQNQKQIASAFGSTAESVGVGWLPHFHDMGLIGNYLHPLYVGFPIFLMAPSAFLKKPVRWLQAISRYRADMSGGPNFGYELCMGRIRREQCQELDLSCWKLAFTGAEPIRYTTNQRFSSAFKSIGFRHKAFYPCYGMAEATLILSGGNREDYPVDRHVDVEELEKNNIVQPDPQGHTNTKTLVGCGQPVIESEVRIVDPDTFRSLPDNQVGEVWAAGQNIAQGYWQASEESTATFRATLSNIDDGRQYLRTGDLGFMDSGELFVTGRLKDLIIISGRNIYPQDIEQSCRQVCPEIRANGIVAFSTENDNDERLVIVAEIDRKYLQCCDQNRVELAIRTAVSQQHQVNVGDIELVQPNSIPVTTSGKLQRRRCRTLFLAGKMPSVTAKGKFCSIEPVLEAG